MLCTFVAAALAFSAPASMVQSNAVVVRSSPVAMSTQYTVAAGVAKKKNPKTGSTTNLKGYTVGSRAPPMAVKSGTTIFEQYGKTRCETLTIEPQDPTSSFCGSVTAPWYSHRFCSCACALCRHSDASDGNLRKAPDAERGVAGPVTLVALPIALALAAKFGEF